MRESNQDMIHTTTFSSPNKNKKFDTYLKMTTNNSLLKPQRKYFNSSTFYQDKNHVSKKAQLVYIQLQSK